MGLKGKAVRRWPLDLTGQHRVYGFLHLQSCFS
jgi:hypothetical protein